MKNDNNEDYGYYQIWVLFDIDYQMLDNYSMMSECSHHN